VGKTTCARIFSKAVNGNLGVDMSELQYSVFELDAASNNSVEDIRSIVDSVRIPPQTSRFKVYIIDEVHMLSQAAFNAFLKTLEEPPAHAIFILATTEKHKILPTILSRCQIFDFNRIRVKDIADHLEYIAGQEGIEFERDALHVIAEKADGAMRDALSIFDQVVAFCGGKLTYSAVIENLNVLDYDYYFTLTDMMVNEDIAGGLKLFDDILSKGFDGHHFINGFGSHLRNLLVCRDPKTVTLLEVSENVGKRYADQSSNTDLRMLIQALQFINECDNQYKSSRHQRLLVELTIMKLASIPYNQREGEKKKFKLKPFRSGEKIVASYNPAIVQEKLSAPAKEKQPPVSETAASVLVPQDAPAKSSAKPVGLGLKSLRVNTVERVPVSSTSLEQVAQADRVYSLDEMNLAWKAFTEEVLANDLMVQSVFQMAELVMKDENRMEVRVPGSTQVLVFNEHRGALADFMRERFGIQGVELSVIKTAITDVAVEYQTDKQKYEIMVKDYPLLDEMRKRLKLRIDY
jgi:DNA polymerase-3 subunit gamma/tau